MSDFTLRPVNNPPRKCANIYVNFTDDTDIAKIAATLKVFPLLMEDCVKYHPEGGIDNLTISINFGNNEIT